jgi:uncharacterized protein YbaR (Trm112 family)
MTVSTKLVGVLACPLCKLQVVLVNTGTHLECSACELLYPVRNDIPIMLVEEAEKKININ